MKKKNHRSMEIDQMEPNNGNNNIKIYLYTLHMCSFVCVFV